MCGEWTLLVIVVVYYLAQRDVGDRLSRIFGGVECLPSYVVQFFAVIGVVVAEID